MHIEAENFTLHVKRQFPAYFKNKRVLDVGAGDINGNNRTLFEDCDYDGNDVGPAPNVTIVSKTSQLPFHDGTFDVICSTECFEHDPEYALSFQKIVSMLKPGGLFFFTCASTGRPEHGTKRTSPQDSYGTIHNLEDMQDYYKNLTIEDFCQVLSIKDTFSLFRSYYNSHSKDLYFWGIKNGESLKVEEYNENGVSTTTNTIF